VYNRPVCCGRAVYLLMLTAETILQGRYRIVRQLKFQFALSAI
jgi:hypothetical protein